VPLGDLVANSAGLDAVTAGVPIGGVTLDSRSVQGGDLYAALPGRLTHGARFADAAVSAGAVAVLTDHEGAALCPGLSVPVVVVDQPRRLVAGIAARVYGEPGSALQVLGVTGTNGKTTVATMVESGLRAAGRTTGLIGTIGIRIAGEQYPGARTTPESPDLQAVLAVMRDAAVQSVVMEVSSIALEEHRVDALRYDVAAFTNLTQDHLDYHGTMEAYFAAKARLFDADRTSRGIVSIDDEWGRRLAAEATCAVQTWSLLDPNADWHLVRDRGLLTVVDPDGHRQPIDVPLPGSFNAANALCAFAMLREAGVDAAAAARGIAGVEVPGRMQVVGDVEGVRGIVDYAHSPDAIARVLRAARDVCTGRVIAVVGAGGDRDRAKRPLMGEVAARLADLVVVTDDNPRSEDPARIRASVLEGAMLVAPGERADILEEAARDAAITVAVARAEAGDVVLVLGKGHEQGQEVDGIVTPFDDATVLAAALGTRRSA
jgi:UDP-N-acetylmuramoyl-L-alanyl-D-glutamate--2,6-diaminopimelate ligase